MANEDKTTLLNFPLPLQSNSNAENIEVVRSAIVAIDAELLKISSSAPTPTPAPAPSPSPATSPATQPTIQINQHGVIQLEDELDLIHGVGAWSYNTATNTGTDIGSALVSACTKLRDSYGRGTIVIGPGQFLLANPPSADKLSGITVRGAGSMATVVTYKSASGVAFNFSGAGGYTGGGVQSMAIFLAAGLGDTNAIAINAEGDATYQPDQLRFSDLYITAGAGSQWFNGIRMHGNSRTSPQGIRNTWIESVQIFCCRGAGAWFSNVVQFFATNLGVYVGTGGGSNIYLAGGGQANKNSIQAYLQGIVCIELNVTNTSRFTASGVADRLAIDGTATQGNVTLFGASLSGSLSSSVMTRF